MPFGDVVRARRTALMISLNDMAERLGISPGYWSRV
ncbi:MAG: helix-turn-helix transcriptional regulator, partial [Roseomonas sp.]|nr:helix-turn-helix transcriptional regulator [Roseomonas sp.]MCA3291303.1 helix-turn-helix transcriptional regulator [Roseomonas sp.]